MLLLTPAKTTSAPLVCSTRLSIRKHDRAAVASIPTLSTHLRGGKNGTRL